MTRARLDLVAQPEAWRGTNDVINVEAKNWSERFWRRLERASKESGFRPSVLQQMKEQAERYKQIQEVFILQEMPRGTTPPYMAPSVNFKQHVIVFKRPPITEQTKDLLEDKVLKSYDKVFWNIDDFLDWFKKLI